MFARAVSVIVRRHSVVAYENNMRIHTIPLNEGSLVFASIIHGSLAIHTYSHTTVALALANSVIVYGVD